MVTIDGSLKSSEVDLLRSMKGRRLEAIGFVPVFDNMAFGRVRLYLEDGCVDVVADMRGVDYDEDGREETDDSFMGIEVAAEDLCSISEINGEERRIRIGKAISRVLVASWQDVVFDEGEAAFGQNCVQAVVLDLGDEYACIDKEDGPWAMLYAKRGGSVEEVVSDCSEAWEDDIVEQPNRRNSFTQDVVEL